MNTMFNTITLQSIKSPFKLQAISGQRPRFTGRDAFGRHSSNHTTVKSSKLKAKLINHAVNDRHVPEVISVRPLGNYLTGLTMDLTGNGHKVFVKLSKRGQLVKLNILQYISYI